MQLISHRIIEVWVQSKWMEFHDQFHNAFEKCKIDGTRFIYPVRHGKYTLQTGNIKSIFRNLKNTSKMECICYIVSNFLNKVKTNKTNESNVTKKIFIE